MGKRPKNVRCPFCGKFMKKSKETLSDTGFRVQSFSHQHCRDGGMSYSFASKSFATPDGEKWFYIGGAKTYQDLHGVHDCGMPNCTYVTDVAVIDRLKRWHDEKVAKEQTVSLPIKTTPDKSTTITAGDLYAAIKKLPIDAPVYAYDVETGDRFSVTADVWHDGSLLDLNFSSKEN